MSARRNGREAALGTFGLDATGREPLRACVAQRRGGVVLRVPGDAVLEREVALPAAAERSLDQVLAFEMDRLTPFSADEVHWSWTLLRRDRALNRIVLRLAVVPKARVAAPLAALDAAGAPAGALEAAHGQDGAAGLRIGQRIALRTGKPEGAWARRALAGLATVCALLAVAAVALPFALQSVRGAAAEERIAALRPRVDEVEALRRRALSGGADRDAAAAERARVGDALGVLASLTAVLPDDTFLMDFTLRGGQVTISGQSGGAVRLIGLIAADPMFRNPAFTAPVTRAEGPARRDLFSLRADAAPAAGDVRAGDIRAGDVKAGDIRAGDIGAGAIGPGR